MILKKYRLLTGELAHKEEGCASRVYEEKGIDIYYAEDVDKEIERLKEKNSEDIIEARTKGFEEGYQSKESEEGL